MTLVSSGLFLLVLAGASDSAAYQVRADTLYQTPDLWLGQDKFWHAAMSFAMVGSFYHFMNCRLDRPRTESSAVALGATFGLGIFKEVMDARRPHDRFSWKDLAFDLLGVGLGFAAFIAGGT